jgi:hypothetical protein
MHDLLVSCRELHVLFFASQSHVVRFFVLKVFNTVPRVPKAMHMRQLENMTNKIPDLMA